MRTIAEAAQKMNNGNYIAALAVADELLLAGGDCRALLPLKVSALIELGRAAEAKSIAAELAELMPENAYAQFLLLRARFLDGERNLTAAIKDVLQSGKNLTEAVKEKLYNLSGQCSRFLGDGHGAAQAYKEAARYADTPLLKATEYSNYLFNLHYCPGLRSAELKREALGYGKIWQGLPQFFQGPRQHEKLRIGYISPDIREHVVLKFSYALFRNYNHDDFAVFCYQNGPEDNYSQRVKAMTDGWRNITGLSAADTARLIYEDGIDILFDLAGHTRGNSLPVLAYKPAPVQLSGIGYFASTGLDTVDYVLSDRYLAGEKNMDIITAAAEDFSERLLVLPESHFCYVPFAGLPDVSEAPCQRNGYVTFGSFNNFTKVTDEVLGVWKSILDKLPAAHLLLKAEIFDNAAGAKIVKDRLKRLGFDLSRVECRGFTRDYMTEYGEVDIALDTFPYPGGGTTLDALYMGVPVLTLAGRTQGERFGASILANLGLNEFVCETVTEYADRAVLFAENKQLLAQLRQGLRSLLERSALMDAKRYMKNIENAYRLIWREYTAGLTVPSVRECPRLLQQARAFFAAGDLSQAQAVADSLLLATGLDAYALRTLAEIYIDAENAAGAKKATKRLLAKRSGDAYVLFLAARANALAGENDEAECYVKSSLEAGSLTGDQLGLAHDLLGRIYKESGRAGQAAEEYRAACAAMESAAGKRAAYDNYLLSLHYIEAEGAAIKRVAEEYGTLYADIVPYVHDKQRQHEKIHIGYVSADFRRHVMSNFVRGFFRDYDKLQFEVYGYMAGKADDLTGEFADACDKWRDISSLSDAEAAELILADEIDILVDLSGHTAGNRLGIFAYKPAPVQVAGIGYMSTTGLQAIDYFFGDVYLDDNGEDFTEEIISLPHSHFLYQPQEVPEHTEPAPFLKNGYVTFGSFNNFTKVTDEMLALWAEIMRRVPGSRFFLKAAAFADETNKAMIYERLKRNGIDISRVDTEGWSADYFAAYNRVDIALDTYPYPGGGTTCDALIMGVPVITRSGLRHGSRFSLSLLSNTGLADLCAQSAAAYIENAVALAEDKTRLSELHLTLRRSFRQSPVMDRAVYMDDLETAYRTIWQRWTGTADIDNYFSLAEKYFAAGDNLRMISYGKKAIAAGENGVAPAYYCVARGLNELGRHIEAWQYYKDGADYVARYGLGRDDAPEIRRGLIGNAAHKGFALGIAGSAELFKQAAELYGKTEKMYFGLKSSWLLALHAGEHSAAEIFDEHLQIARQVFDSLPAEIPAEAGNDREERCSAAARQAVPVSAAQAKQSQKKIRIGYLSPDFRHHVMFSFYYVLLNLYDHEQFAVYCYSLTDKGDAFTEVLREAVDGWRDCCNLDYRETVRIIREDEIDILVDLAGHSADNGLPVLAYKPARIQLSGLGYMDTTGLAAMDYIFTDSVAAPVGSEKYFSEKLLPLTSLFCYTGRNDVPQPQPAPCKEKGYIVFGCFNQYAKYTDEMLSLWREIMTQVPQSRLLLKDQHFNDAATVDMIYGRLKKLGLPMERVVFEAASYNYLERYLAVDIALDTYPWPGGGTTCDALYMGVPVISRYGERFGSRFGLSILTAAGLPDLAAGTAEEYVARAVGLANDIELLDMLHQNLRLIMQKAPLMNGKEYVREIEAYYRTIAADREGY